MPTADFCPPQVPLAGRAQGRGCHLTDAPPERFTSKLRRTAPVSWTPLCTLIAKRTSAQFGKLK